MRNIIQIALVALLGISLPVLAQFDEATDELSDLISQTVENHPTVAAARAKLQAAETRITQAAGWPDPVLTGGASNYPLALNPVNISRFPMTSTRIGISQRLPNPGTIELRQHAARQESVIAATAIEAARLQLATEVKRLYIRLKFNREQTDVLHQLKDVLTDLQQVVTTKFESGLVPLTDVLRLQNLQDDVDARLLELNRQFSTELENLYWFTGRDGSKNELRFTAKLSQPSQDAEALMATAVAERPDFEDQRGRIALSSTRTTLAEKEMAIDVAVSAAWGYRWDMTDLWTATVSITLPFHRERERARVAEEEANLRTEQLMLTSLQRRLRADINSVLARRKALKQELNYYDAVLTPNLETTAQASLASFEADQAELDAYLEVQTRIISTSLAQVAINRELALLTAELQALIGQILPYIEVHHDE